MKEFSFETWIKAAELMYRQRIDPHLWMLDDPTKYKVMEYLGRSILRTVKVENFVT